MTTTMRTNGTALLAVTLAGALLSLPQISLAAPGSGAPAGYRAAHRFAPVAAVGHRDPGRTHVDRGSDHAHLGRGLRPGPGHGRGVHPERGRRAAAGLRETAGRDRSVAFPVRADDG